LANYDYFVVHNGDNDGHAMLVVDGDDDARDDSSNHDNNSLIVTASVVAAAAAAAAADFLRSKMLVDIRCVEERDDCEDGTIDADPVVVVLDDTAEVGNSFQMMMNTYLYSQWVNHNNDDCMMNVNDCNHYWVDDDDDNDDLLDGHDNSWTAIGVERTHGQRMDHDCVVVDYC